MGMTRRRGQEYQGANGEAKVSWRPGVGCRDEGSHFFYSLS